MSIVARSLLDRHIAWFTRLVRAIYSLGLEGSSSTRNTCIEIGRKLRSIARRVVDYYASQGSVDTLLYLFSKSGIDTARKIYEKHLPAKESYDDIRSAVADICREGGSPDAIAHSLLLLFLLRVLGDIYGVDSVDFEEAFDTIIEKTISDAGLLEALNEQVLCSLASARRSIEAFIKAGEE
ncbi:hypothetical protein PYJP_06350 [Pyrofollis japonicus]|uniref:hypothetical protein n=1 Tax=Pyrofollis japonicus TaxID=3060460 RepID=UPI00295C1596|nr:hypothetical protein [Pyrofollis japonicus]BEP17283.1 hypothetical protein PYJP_06350 [Pyrofollis japonicus]